MHPTAPSPRLCDVGSVLPPGAPSPADATDRSLSPAPARLTHPLPPEVADPGPLPRAKQGHPVRTVGYGGGGGSCGVLWGLHFTPSHSFITFTFNHILHFEHDGLPVWVRFLRRSLRGPLQRAIKWASICPTLDNTDFVEFAKHRLLPRFQSLGSS